VKPSFAVLLSLFPALLLSACASTMPATPDNRSGTLEVYQPLSSHSGGTEPYLYVDDHRIGRLGIGAVETVRLEAGPHRIAVREALLFWPGQESAVAHVTIAIGGKTWLRFNRQQVGVTVDAGNANAVTRPTLDEVDAIQGEAHR
jgi:hypothetical protein